MKILRVRFRNLASLKGTFTIDFTDPGYDTSIFAITGRTGSGKSTILDAITLAMYAKTPRLPDISESHNDIMTKNTGECFSEVDFSTDEGRFRVSFSQTRARRKPDGRLQSPIRSIMDLDRDEILTSGKIRDVNNKVIELVQLDFEQFCQTVMLSQGKFGEFLASDEKHRADLLEKITGKGIYSEIGRRVFERRKLEENEMNTLKARAGDIVLLTDDEKNEIERCLCELRDLQKRKEIERDSILFDISYFRDLKSHEERAAALDDESEVLKKDKEAFAPDSARLDRAIDAGYVTPLRDRLLLQKKSDDALELRIAELNRSISAYTERRAVLSAEAVKLDEESRVLSAEAEETRDRIRRAGLIDKDISLVNTSINEIKGRMEELDRLVEDGRRNMERLEGDSLADIGTEKDCVSKLEEIPYGRKLSSEIGTLEYKFGSMERLLGGISCADAIRMHDELKIQLEEKRRLSEEFDKAVTGNIGILSSDYELWISDRDRLSQLEKDISEKQKELDENTGNLAVLRESEEKQKKIVRLAEMVSDFARYLPLEKDEICPLCGSVHHERITCDSEYDADREKAELDDIGRRISDISIINARIAGVMEQKRHDADEIRGSSRFWMSELDEEKVLEALKLNHETEEIIRRIEGLPDRSVLDEHMALCSRLRDEYGCDDIRTLRRKSDEYADLEALLERTRTSLAGIRSDIEKVGNIVSSSSVQLEGEKRKLDDRNSELERLTGSRRTVFGDLSCDEEEEKLRSREKNLSDRKASSDAGLLTVSTQIEGADASLKSSVDDLNKGKSLYDELDSSYRRELEIRNFTCEDDYLLSVMDENERKSLSSLRDSLIRRESALDGSLRMLLEERRTLESRSKKVKSESLESASADQEKLKDELSSLAGEITGYESRLINDRKNIERIGSLRDEMEKRQKQLDVWSLLNDLIGSSDGAKFRKFAQSITFRTLIAFANQRLEKMMNRYVLKYDDTRELSFLLHDKNLAGGRDREISNISGGEKFIVSLSLALGLSSMVSRNVKIESFFLDEGFGSLSDDVLQTALDYISRLREDGKLIGVISHVEKVKEYIYPQLEITCDDATGTGTLKGPGVTFSP